MEELKKSFFDTVMYYVIKNGEALAFSKIDSVLDNPDFKGCPVIVAPAHIAVYFREVK